MTKQEEAQQSKGTDRYIMGLLDGVSHLQSVARQQIEMVNREKCEVLSSMNVSDVVEGPTHNVKMD
ncbi:hypothetical protein LINPERHAP2_LOCUS24464 [Linum perenne]